MTDLSSGNRDHVVHKAESIYGLPFTEKCYQILAFILLL